MGKKGKLRRREAFFKKFEQLCSIQHSDDKALKKLAKEFGLSAVYHAGVDGAKVEPKVEFNHRYYGDVLFIPWELKERDYEAEERYKEFMKDAKPHPHPVTLRDILQVFDLADLHPENSIVCKQAEMWIGAMIQANGLEWVRKQKDSIKWQLDYAADLF
jgi:hypothetical protein